MYRLVIISINLSETLVTFCSRQNPKHFFSKKNFFPTKKIFSGIFSRTEFCLELHTHWWIWGVPPVHAPPPQQDPFLSFSHMFLLKSVRIGGRHPSNGSVPPPPQWEILDPPLIPQLYFVCNHLIWYLSVLNLTTKTYFYSFMEY